MGELYEVQTLKSDNDIFIEKNVPMPKRGRGKYGRLAAEMAVGDSVLFTHIPEKGFQPMQFANTQASNLIRNLKALSYDGQMRKMADEPTQYRVWRTK